MPDCYLKLGHDSIVPNPLLIAPLDTVFPELLPQAPIYLRYGMKNEGNVKL
jgi:hypothetical protein